MPTINQKTRKTDYTISQNKIDYQKIYQDRRWKLIRQFMLREHPLCQECEKKNRVTPATQVHHVIPFDTGRNQKEVESLAFDLDNTMTVCDECHAAIHQNLRRS